MPVTAIWGSAPSQIPLQIDAKKRKNIRLLTFLFVILFKIALFMATLLGFGNLDLAYLTVIIPH
jgi:hypothetical protein